MFVIVVTYRARAGEEDAIIALHENQKNNYDSNTNGYRAWQLFRRVDEPQEFISIAQFADESLVQITTKDLEKNGWYSRLVSLMETSPLQISCTLAWSLF